MNTRSRAAFAIELLVKSRAVGSDHPRLLYGEARVLAMFALYTVCAAIERSAVKAEVVDDLAHKRLAPQRAVARPLPGNAATELLDNLSYG